MRSKRRNTPLTFIFSLTPFIPLFSLLPFFLRNLSHFLKNGSLSLINQKPTIRRSKSWTSHFNLSVSDLRRAPLSHHHGQPNLLIPSDTQILIQSTTKPPFKSMEARGHPQTPHMVIESPTSKSKPQPRRRDTQALKRKIGGRGRLTKKKSFGFR